jgi:hypothetical protein
MHGQDEIPELKTRFERTGMKFSLAVIDAKSLPGEVALSLAQLGASHAEFETSGEANLLENVRPGERVGIESEVRMDGEVLSFRFEGVLESLSVLEESGLPTLYRLKVGLDELNLTRLVSAAERVEARIQELKEFFRYAKGA